MVTITFTRYTIQRKYALITETRKDENAAVFPGLRGTLGVSGGDQRAPLAVRPAPNITASSGALAGKTSIVTSHVEHPSTSRAAITPPAIPPPPNVHPRFGSQGDGTPTKSKIDEGGDGGGGKKRCFETHHFLDTSWFTLHVFEMNVLQHSTSASTLTTPLGNITEPPASLFVSTAAVAEGAKNGSLDPSSKRHNTSAPTLTKAAPNSGNNFRASSYLAATAREVHAAKSRSAVIETDDQGTVPSPSVVQNASNGEAAVYRETVFGVKPKNMSAETLTPPITDSAQPGTKVIPASPISSVSKVEQIGSQNGALDRTPIGHSFGPDPFEVSSSVKRIANRNRYSQVFADKTRPTATTSSGVSQSATFAAPVGAALLRPPSTQTPRSDADVNASTSMFLPPPSSLLVGHTEASSARTANVTSSAALENNSSIYARPGLVPNPVSPAPQQNSTQYASTSVTYNQGFVSGYMGSSKSAGTVQSCGLPNFIGQQPVPIHTFHPAQPRDLTHRDSTPILEGYSRTGFATAIPSTSAASQRGQPLASIATKSVDVVRMNRPTFLYDANLSNSARSGLPADLRTMGAIGAVGILQPKRLSSSTQSTSLANDEILGLFDPLSSTASASSTTNASAGAKPTLSNPVDMVLKNALFARREKCAAMLRRCNNDVARAVRELKTDELLAMGIAKDRAQAVSALEDCRWDLNAAAAALLT
ncbi:unnamed protein product [Toxocara canis]|uniref:UBA domain-containing protein n=1 Tax=Toxocara canis TaxID=6265 RepID=A0A183V865_TOXCA|nr:unnamed protein product [Toxocara canis]